MCEGQERVVLGEGGAGGELGVDLGDRPEQLDGRVDQMAVQVEQHPSPIGRGRVLAPAVLGHRTPTLPTPFEAQDLADRAFGQQSAQGQLLGVPPSVLKHGQPTADSICVRHDHGGLRSVHPQRLVDDDRQAGVEAGQCLLRVRARRASQYDEINPVLEAQQRIQVGDDYCIGLLRERHGPPIGVRCRDHGHRQTGSCQ